VCGRFINIEKKEEIIKLFPSSKVLNYSNKSYNISPSNLINVIYKNNNNIYIDNLFWSFSYYNKQNNITQFVINSRIETIVSKYLFKESFIKRKCLIISNGYFEWKKIDNTKQPYFISIPKNELMFFGGIWRQEIKNNVKKNVVCIITKDANEDLSKIHSRMPLIMSHNEGLEFLNDNDNRFLENNKSVFEDDIDYYPVSKIVNNPKNNDENCIKEITL
jgi:putative SOS response-associated peptidase YedK